MQSIARIERFFGELTETAVEPTSQAESTAGGKTWKTFGAVLIRAKKDRVSQERSFQVFLMTDPAVLDIHRQVDNVVNKTKKDRASQKKFLCF